MAEMIKVRAVEGRIMPFDPRDRRPGYVGYRDATPAESAHHTIPCRLNGKSADKRFVRDVEPTLVRDAVYYRDAIKCGDLERVVEATAPAQQQEAEPKKPRSKGEV